MAELRLSLGNADADTLETALLFSSFSSVLQWIFFIIVAIIILLILVKCEKKKNANSDKNKHS